MATLLPFIIYLLCENFATISFIQLGIFTGFPDCGFPD